MNATSIRAELLNFAGLSDQAYQPSGQRNLTFYNLKMVAEIDTAADIHCFIAARDEYLVVIFRGTRTQDLKNWLTDAEALPLPWPYMFPTPNVHLGFAEGYQSARGPMLAAIGRYQTVLGKPLTVVFAGHSLGAALATLAAADFAAQSTPHSCASVALRTFGSPRVGDSSFTREANNLGPILRCVHADDIVPQVPAGFGYRHVTGLVHINSDGSIVGPLQRSWWRRLFGFDRVVVDDVDGVAVNEHFLPAYVAAISKMKV